MAVAQLCQRLEVAVATVHLAELVRLALVRLARLEVQDRLEETRARRVHPHLLRLEAHLVALALSDRAVVRLAALVADLAPLRRVVALREQQLELLEALALLGAPAHLVELVRLGPKDHHLDPRMPPLVGLRSEEQARLGRQEDLHLEAPHHQRRLDRIQDSEATDLEGPSLFQVHPQRLPLEATDLEAQQ